MRNDCKAAGFSYILLDPRLENSATAVLAFLSQNLIHIIFGGCYFSRLEGLAASTGVWTLGRMIPSGSLPNNQELVFTPRVCHRSDPSAHNCHGIICFAVSTTWVIILQVAATVWVVVCDSAVWPPVIVIVPYTDPKSSAWACATVAFNTQSLWIYSLNRLTVWVFHKVYLRDALLKKKTVKKGDIVPFWRPPPLNG